MKKKTNNDYFELYGGEKMRVAEIGDNCIDVYERIGKKYPTGNVVDTGVNLQKLGIPVSIISTTGNDENGKWMLETLKKEGVDVSHLKIGDGATAVTYMDMDGKDRVHGDYVEGVLENIVLMKKILNLRQSMISFIQHFGEKLRIPYR